LSCVVFELSSRVRSVASTFSSPVPYTRVRTRNCSEPSSESHATLLGSRLENRQVVVNQGNQDDGQHVTRGRSGWPQRCKTQRGVAGCSGLGHEEFHERYPGWSTVRRHAQSSAPSAAESDWRTQPRLDFRRRAASMESRREGGRRHLGESVRPAIEVARTARTRSGDPGNVMSPSSAVLWTKP
jgi:hypothetical protein